MCVASPKAIGTPKNHTHLTAHKKIINAKRGNHSNKKIVAFPFWGGRYVLSEFASKNPILGLDKHKIL